MQAVTTIGIDIAKSVFRLLQDQGDLATARALHNEVLTTLAHTIDPEHPLIGASLANLALVHQAQGDIDLARPIFGRALQIEEETLVPRLQKQTVHVTISPPSSFRPVPRPKRLPSLRPLAPIMRRLSDQITLGRRTAPASLPMRSTRLDAQRMRRCCGSGIGARSRGKSMTALTETADRQSLWSSTADVLKRRFTYRLTWPEL